MIFFIVLEYIPFVPKPLHTLLFLPHCYVSLRHQMFIKRDVVTDFNSDFVHKFNRINSGNQ